MSRVDWQAEHHPQFERCEEARRLYSASGVVRQYNEYSSAMKKVPFVITFVMLRWVEITGVSTREINHTSILSWFAAAHLSEVF